MFENNLILLLSIQNNGLILYVNQNYTTIKTQVINSLTPSISTFLTGLRSYRAGMEPKNLIFANFMSRVDIHTREGKLYHSYKLFVYDVCTLAEATGKRGFEVVNDVPIKL
jgi:hypothetical protein